jgi:hypothetical protein
MRSCLIACEMYSTISAESSYNMGVMLNDDQAVTSLFEDGDELKGDFIASCPIRPCNSMLEYFVRAFPQSDEM